MGCKEKKGASKKEGKDKYHMQTILIKVKILRIHGKLNLLTTSPRTTTMAGDAIGDRRETTAAAKLAQVLDRSDDDGSDGKRFEYGEDGTSDSICQKD